MMNRLLTTVLCSLVTVCTAVQADPTRPRLVVGIVVDGVSDVLSLTAEQIRPAPEFAVTLSTEYLTGLGALGDRMLILVNIEKLLNSEEMALLDSAASEVA